jgi:hypothetical protein
LTRLCVSVARNPAGFLAWWRANSERLDERMREFNTRERDHLDAFGDPFEFYLTTALGFVVDIALDYLDGGTPDE